MNVVLVVHANGNGKYMFRVPELMMLKAGDLVLCDTATDPNAIGMCVTDSFKPADPEKITKIWGSRPDRMKPVIARLRREDIIWPEDEKIEEKFDDDVLIN